MNKNYDVIIIGTGVAGLYTALNLSDKLSILLVTKRELSLCNSSLAQGGVAAVYNPTDDNTQLHTNDTLIAGGFKNNLDAIKILVTDAAAEMEEIIGLGVEFDKNADGSYHKTLEGGHSRHRILHHKDATGKELVTKLSAAVRELKHVEILENTMLCGMKETSTGFSLDVMDEGGKHNTLATHFCVLATGGIGRVYEYTTNSAIATGDGIAFAYEMGAIIKNLHFVQFHPTAFNNKRTRECFLISEAVRGEGAYLLNCKGERFMQDYDERLELAPRDVVSYAIIAESRKLSSEEFYLDISHKDSAFLKERFPMIFENLLAEGYDLTKDHIPIFPCQHYLMGGIDVNTRAETSLTDLYAVGECSHTGVHGNNRLASNSLLEALVFSHQAALDINDKAQAHTQLFENAAFEENVGTEPLPTGIRTEIRHIMQESYFVLPDKSALLNGFQRVRELKALLERENFLVNADFVEAKALATIAYLILKEVI